MGTLIWQLNDTWPVCSWASLDHGGGWKLLHHMARDFYQQVLVTAVPTADGYVLRAVNDLPLPVEVTVMARAVNMAGETRDLGQATVMLTEAAVDVMTVAKDTLDADEMLAMVWEGSDGTRSGDVWAPLPYKSYDLAPPGLTMTTEHNDGIWHITISAKALAHFVTVEADQPGRFSDNAFALFPGQPTTINFTAADGASTPTFTLRDLYTATTARH